MRRAVTWMVISLVPVWTGMGFTQVPEPLEKPVTEAVETAHDVQGELDSWAQEKESLEVRYKSAQANIAWLSERLRLQGNVEEELDGDIAEYSRRLVEAGRLQNAIQDTLDAVLGRLETVVAEDLPFLHEERQGRLEMLASLNARDDVPAAEKLRRLLEAMIIEAQYGKTVEVTAGNIPVGPRNIHADILRIGRLVMFWRTPDKKEFGTWDPATAQWVPLPGGERRVINRAFDMAAHVRPTELISLPLGRITR